MPLFLPDFFYAGDVPGFGAWRTGHYLEHRQFIAAGLNSSPIVFIPDFDFWAWSEDEQAQLNWITEHARVHEIIDSRLGISGFDVSFVDMSDQNGLAVWLDVHRQDHAAERAALGIVG